MSNKNGFELRTDILAMAKDYMDKQYQLNMEFARKAFDEAVAAQKVSADAWKKYVPEIYTIEDLMKKAQELYGFVSSK
jgi:hypothetical protein